jgi:hypothetical protein
MHQGIQDLVHKSEICLRSAAYRLKPADFRNGVQGLWCLSDFDIEVSLQ